MCKDTSITNNYNKTKENSKIATYPLNSKVPIKFSHAIVRTSNNKEYKVLILNDSCFYIKIKWINCDLIIPYSTMSYKLSKSLSLKLIGFTNE